VRLFGGRRRGVFGHGKELGKYRNDLHERTQRIDELSGTTKCGRFDPANPERPRWRIDYHAARGAHQLSFSPLAVKGVEFEVRLPTAQQRLIASEHPYNDDIDAEVERLNAHFRVVGER
jgi:hypothetical protein